MCLRHYLHRIEQPFPSTTSTAHCAVVCAQRLIKGVDHVCRATLELLCSEELNPLLFAVQPDDRISVLSSEYPNVDFVVRNAVLRFWERVDPAAEDKLAIIWASIEGKVDVVRLLLAWVSPNGERVDPAAQDNKAIRLASREGEVDVVRLLLADARVDPAARNNAASKEASRNGHLEVVRLLNNDYDDYDDDDVDDDATEDEDVDEHGRRCGQPVPKRIKLTPI
jgi:ankyrin repeat protein